MHPTFHTFAQAEETEADVVKPHQLLTLHVNLRLVCSLLHDGMGVTDIFFQTYTPTGISFSFHFSLPPFALQWRECIFCQIFLSFFKCTTQSNWFPFQGKQIIELFNSPSSIHAVIFVPKFKETAFQKKKTRYGSPFPDDACSEDCPLSGEPLSTKKCQDGHSG